MPGFRGHDKNVIHLTTDKSLPAHAGPSVAGIKSCSTKRTRLAVTSQPEYPNDGGVALHTQFRRPRDAAAAVAGERRTAPVAAQA
jgi:hypothetical protein